MIVALACLAAYALIGWGVASAYAGSRSESASAFEADGQYAAADFILDYGPYLDAAVWPLALAVYLAQRGR